MVQQVQDCSHCGQRLGYIAGLRGFGLRERRHATRCLARSGITKIAEVEDVMKIVSGELWFMTNAAMANAAMKIAEMEDVQFSIEEDTQSQMSESVEVRSSPLLPFGKYYSANFKASSTGVWDQLYAQFLEVSKPEAAQLTSTAEMEECKVGVIGRVVSRENSAPKAAVAERGVQRWCAAVEQGTGAALVEGSAAVRERNDAGSELLMRLATMLDVALASGDLARAVNEVIVEQGVLSFQYTWLQHSQTPLPTHLEDERKRLGIDEEADWQIRLSATDNEGFFLEVSDALREDQFPAGVEFDARGTWWYYSR